MRFLTVSLYVYEDRNGVASNGRSTPVDAAVDYLCTAMNKHDEASVKLLIELVSERRTQLLDIIAALEPARVRDHPLALAERQAAVRRKEETEVEYEEHPFAQLPTGLDVLDVIEAIKTGAVAGRFTRTTTDDLLDYARHLDNHRRDVKNA